jgi:hypothetical protein
MVIWEQSDRLVYLTKVRLDRDEDVIAIRCEVAETGKTIQELEKELKEVFGEDHKLPKGLRLVLSFGGGAGPQPATIFGLIRFRNSWMLAIVSEMDSSFGLTLPSCRSFKTHTACSSSIHISMFSCLVSTWKA